MIRYLVLGEVSAQNGSWRADLAPQHQLLLAALVLERSRPVSRAGLTRVLWGDDEDSLQDPEAALRRVVAELRKILRSGTSSADPVPSKGDTYRLPLDEQQADVLRFRAKVKQARDATGGQARQLMNAALHEWGPGAEGLFGGNPLSGLRGQWAEATREALRHEYRDARFWCLQQKFWCLQQKYGTQEFSGLAAECRELANEPAALADENFLVLWMFATYRAGQRTSVERIYRRAKDAAAQLGVSLTSRIDYLATMMRDENPQLAGPGKNFAADLGQLSADRPRRPLAEGQTMSDSNVIFRDFGLPEGRGLAGAAHPAGLDASSPEERPAGPGHESPTDPAVTETGEQSEIGQQSVATGVRNVFRGPVDAKYAVFGNQVNHNYGKQ